MTQQLASPREFRVPGANRIRGHALPVFYRSLAALLNTGMPIGNCLRSMETQQMNRNMRAMISWIRMDIEKGSTVSDSIHQFPSIFDSASAGMIKASEKTGRMPETFIQIAGMLETSHKIRRRIKIALLYPTIILSFAMSLVWFLVTFVLPAFADLSTSFGARLPASTTFLLRAAHFVHLAALPTLLVLLTAILLLKNARRIRICRYISDWIMLAIPYIGSLVQKMAIARFARTYASLLRSGVMVPEAAGIAAEAAANEVIKSSFTMGRTAAEAGNPFSTGLARAQFIPRDFVAMIKTGENSGRTDEMLDTAAEYYESEVKSATTILAVAIVSLATILVCLIVGGIIVAALTPILELPGEIH